MALISSERSVTQTLECWKTKEANPTLTNVHGQNCLEGPIFTVSAAATKNCSEKANVINF
jgi:regulator of RNase E activity RraA